MAELTESIPKHSWQRYFDDLSKELGTVEATVEIDGRDVGAQLLAEHVLLTGVTYDHGDDIIVFGLDAPGGQPEDAEHIVEHPQQVLVEGALPETGMAIAVDDPEGHRTIVTLARPPALPPADDA
jgi:hypothetical protein